jgi:hypothetical protein
MEVNWTVITYLMVGYFAIAGFSRGWWKEAITTVVLIVFILFLQNPDWAGGFIQAINNAINTIWGYLPLNIRSAISNGVNVVFAVGTSSDQPYQFDASDPGTWLTFLGITAGAAILLGRLSLGSQPTGLGKVLGAVVGGLNGFLMLGLIREYLDGRALPGQQVAAASELRLIGGSAFGPPAPGVSIQASGLPSFTILDSALPWVAMAIGVFFLFSIFRTRFSLASSADGRKIVTTLPPFYKKPPLRPRPPTVVGTIVSTEP